MLIIDSSAAMARALDQPIDPALKRLLTTRRDQLADADDLRDAARFLVVEPPDRLADIEAALGFPITTAMEEDARPGEPDLVPFWEWLEHHAGGWIEVAFILSDDGAADVLLVPETDDVDPALARLLRQAAAPEHQQLSPTKD